MTISGRTLTRSLQKLGLRQNQISHVEFPSSLGETLKDLDLYDNLISHIEGLDSLTSLESLDLSYNKIKHIKNVEQLKELKDLYFVQNKISKVEGLDGLKKLRNLELGGNRIRVGLIAKNRGADADLMQDVENLETLTGLEELWLAKNKITEIQVCRYRSFASVRPC